MRYGYFDNDRREYVIERPDVPVSWTNYLGIRNPVSYTHLDVYKRQVVQAAETTGK